MGWRQESKQITPEGGTHGGFDPDAEIDRRLPVMDSGAEALTFHEHAT